MGLGVEGSGTGVREERRKKNVREQMREEQLLHRIVQRFRGGLVIKARRLCVSLNSKIERNKEEEIGRR